MKNVYSLNRIFHTENRCGCENDVLWNCRSHFICFMQEKKSMSLSLDSKGLKNKNIKGREPFWGEQIIADRSAPHCIYQTEEKKEVLSRGRCNPELVRFFHTLCLAQNKKILDMRKAAIFYIIYILYYIFWKTWRKAVTNIQEKKNNRCRLTDDSAYSIQ